MKLLIITILITAFTITSACCSKKEKKQAIKEIAVVQIEKKSEKEMLNQGYIQASVIYDKDKKPPCSYLIQLDDKRVLEPQSELNSDFKHNNLLIWVKYHPQRRMSRCGKAQPVAIIGMELR